jgi:putative tributyrin esterase
MVFAWKWNEKASLRAGQALMVRASFITRFMAVICLALFLAGCSKKPEVRIDHPRLTPNVRMQDVTFRSISLGRDMRYRAILPNSIAGQKKLPVVYLLHGGGGNYQDWSNYSDVARYAEAGLMLVMPEGASSYYTNAEGHPEDRYEDYIVKDLISDVESKFPAASERKMRTIVGISMGGYGAIKLALVHPELFVFAGGMSSAIDVPSRPFSMKRWGQWRSHRAIFGPWNGEVQHKNDPFVLVGTVDPKNVPYLFLTCGEQEGLLPSNSKLSRLLAARHFQFEYDPGPGSHDWNQWNRRLPELFKSLMEHIGSGNNGKSRVILSVREPKF